MKPLFSFAQLYVLFLFLQCQSSTISGLTEVFEYAHFTFHLQSGDKAYADEVNNKLEENYQRIVGDMGLAAVNRINIYVFNSGASLREAVAAKYPNIYLPGFATGLTPSATDIYLVRPSSGRFTIYIHEFAHCVEQHVNASIPNRPRWLWESVALFEAEEFTEPRNISALNSNTLPRLTDLNDFNNTLIYQVGYLFGEFVFKNFGKEKYIQLIKENGNTASVLGLSEEAFISEWYQYLKRHYNF